MSAHRTPRPMPDRDEQWKVEAACRGQDPAIFFPPTGGIDRRAAQLCIQCPVVEACRSYGSVEPYGTWGLLSEKQRGLSYQSQHPRTKAG